jgi:hypothetical protein
MKRLGKRLVLAAALLVLASVVGCDCEPTTDWVSRPAPAEPVACRLDRGQDGNLAHAGGQTEASALEMGWAAA